MFHFISHKIQIEKSTLFPIWRRSQPKIKFSDFPRPFQWPNKSIISSPHIYECLMLFNSNFGCIIWTLNFLPVLYCVCNEYFLLCRHFNCCQDYIWHIIWIVLCFIQLTSYVSCCFTLNANWKIHSFFTLKETSNRKKNSAIFSGLFTDQIVASNLPHIYTNVWCYWTAHLGALSERWIFFPGAYAKMQY